MKASRSTKIYVVDDERFIADTIRIILVRDGYQAAAFYSPLEALAEIKRSPPDLVLCDLMMPGHSGLVLIKELEKDNASLKCILLTGGLTNPGLRAELRGLRCKVKLLHKPIHPTQLLVQIRAMLEV